jgi:Arylsulfotransferase (ASST)
MLRTVSSIVVFATSFASVLSAQIGTEDPPLSFPHPDGTTHYYQRIHTQKGVTWSEANLGAAKRGGYLATITSLKENDLVAAMIRDGKFWLRVGTRWNGPWVGGVQGAGAKEPAGGWSWAELESFSYANWATGFPDNSSGADRIHFGGSSIATTWVDGPASAKMSGYVIEYSGPYVRRTMGLLQRDQGSRDGYTLISPFSHTLSYLVDARGRTVRTWTSQYPPGAASYLVEGGHLLRCGGVGNKVFTGGGNGGIVEKFDWGGKLDWSFLHSTALTCLHHDIERLPNGNILMIAWVLKTKAEAIAAGRDPAKITQGTIWSEKIIEVKPQGKTGGKIVWEWHAWDHLIQDFDSKKSNHGKVSDHAELIDLNFPANAARSDWLHFNALDYNPHLDQIVISSPNFHELWVIDHSTTTREAAGHTGGKSGKGGDILYRWGNPQAYRAGTTADKKLFFQHDTQWIEKGLRGAGNILIFSNGRARPGGEHSSVEELVPPVNAAGKYARGSGAFGPAKPVWTYTAPTPKDFYARFVSGAQRLPNGNTLIANGPIGQSFEVDTKKATVWRYQTPVSSKGVFQQGDERTGSVIIFRSPRYFASDPILRGRNLHPHDPIEIQDTVLLAEGSTVDHFVKPGADIELSLRAKDLPKAEYLVVSSMTDGAIGLDFRILRMGFDPIFEASLLNQAPHVFQKYKGRLDGNGRAAALIHLPKNPGIIGLDLRTTFVTKSRTARSGLSFISNTVVVKIR